MRWIACVTRSCLESRFQGSAFADILYPATLWLAAVALVALRFRRRMPLIAHDFGLYATLALLAMPLGAAVASLDRRRLAALPLSERDSMDARSLAVGIARTYWYYPGGSELLAAEASSSGWTIHRSDRRRCRADAHNGAAIRSAPALRRPARRRRLASRSLLPLCPSQHFRRVHWKMTLLLAAFFVESLVAVDAGAFASLALIKPFGFIASAIAAVAVRPRWQTLAIAAVPFVVWNVRTIVLWHAGGTIDPRLPYWSTTIAGDPLHAIPELALALLHSPGGILRSRSSFSGSFKARRAA